MGKRFQGFGPVVFAPGFDVGIIPRPPGRFWRLLRQYAAVLPAPTPSPLFLSADPVIGHVAFHPFAPFPASRLAAIRLGFDQWLALRTTAVAIGIVTDREMAVGVASGHKAAVWQLSNGSHDSELVEQKRVSLRIRRAVLTKDIRNFGDFPTKALKVSQGLKLTNPSLKTWVIKQHFFWFGLQSAFFIARDYKRPG